MTADVVDAFYTAFNQRDAEAMVACYHSAIVFEDPVFGELKGSDAGDMWRMLCSNSRDLRISHNLDAPSAPTVVHWVAEYSYPPTGRPVRNEVTARMKISDGLIIDHRDDFDLWKWSAQALGTPGTLFGWTPFLKRAIRTRARTSLERFQSRSS